MFSLWRRKLNGEISDGTKFKAKWHLSDTLEVTVKNFDKPNKLTFVNGGPIEGTLNLSLTSLDFDTTKMQSEFITRPNGFMRAIFPIVKSKIKKQEELNMVNLKNYLEKIN